LKTAKSGGEEEILNWRGVGTKWGGRKKQRGSGEKKKKGGMRRAFCTPPTTPPTPPPPPYPPNPPRPPPPPRPRSLSSLAYIHRKIRKWHSIKPRRPCRRKGVQKGKRILTVSGRKKEGTLSYKRGGD